jgi:hypothetical protein
MVSDNPPDYKFNILNGSNGIIFDVTIHIPALPKAIFGVRKPNASWLLREVQNTLRNIDSMEPRVRTRVLPVCDLISLS